MSGSGIYCIELRHRLKSLYMFFNFAAETGSAVVVWDTCPRQDESMRGCYRLVFCFCCLQIFNINVWYVKTNADLRTFKAGANLHFPWCTFWRLTESTTRTPLPSAFETPVKNYPKFYYFRKINRDLTFETTKRTRKWKLLPPHKK